MLIIVEGPDFSGKSTICHLVYLKLKEANIPVRVSTKCLSQGLIEQVVDWAQEKHDLWAPLKSFIFHFAHMWDYLFWKEKDLSQVIIQESYTHRVLAYDEVYRRRLGRWFLELLEQYRPTPDLTYYLDCPLEMRRERWLKSSSTDPRDLTRFTVNLSTTIRLEEVLKRRAIEDNYISIETYTLTALQCANHIVRDIMKHKNSRGKQNA